MSVRGIVIALLVGQTLVSAQAQTGMPALHLAAHDGALRIVVVGDVGSGTARVSAGIATIGAIDAVIIPGDNVYPCGVRSKDDPHWSVLEPLTLLGVPLFPILGNHDYCGNADAEINAPLPNWHFPAKEYTIRSDVAQFAMIDTEPYLEGGARPGALVRNRRAVAYRRRPSHRRLLRLSRLLPPTRSAPHA
jgi:hypothetical protein